MANTVVAVYDTHEHAQAARQKLQAAGFTDREIHLRASDAAQSGLGGMQSSGTNMGTSSTSSSTSTGTTGSDNDAGFGSGVRNFFREMFGGEREAEHGHADRYAEAVRRGSYVLAVEAHDEQRRDLAAQVMEECNPIDIDERASQWQAAGWQRHDETAAPYSADEISRERTSLQGNRQTNLAQDQQATIPVMEEQLQVGKREVQRGGVRVFQRVIETPVQENVSLREEHVRVERHAVDQPATAKNLDAFKEESFELREMAEEAVVAKTARVVEEVVIGKEVTEKQATISDTVRRTDVEVENLGTQTGLTGVPKTPHTPER
jgi:uncharacterized protein (TIGR02271 family)